MNLKRRINQIFVLVLLYFLGYKLLKFYIFSFYSIIFWHLRLVSDPFPIVPVHLAYQQINQLANREGGEGEEYEGGGEK